MSKSAEFNLPSDFLTKWVAEYKKQKEEERKPRWDILARVVAWMRDGDRSITQEQVNYFPERTPLTQQEFRQLTRWLEVTYTGDIKPVRKSRFPTYRVTFEFDGYRFVWQLTMGQGSALDLLPAGARIRKCIKLERPNE